MNDYLKNTFIRWYFDEFCQTPMFAKMSDTVEGSPWHREGNVGIHTNMVVTEYIGLASQTWTNFELLGALACAFHDVGKPAASEKNGIKFKPERGNYLSFGGHEQISARMWEDYAVKNWTRLTELFKLHSFDIYTVGWMIEHHLPWGVKKTDKVNNMALTAMFATEPDVFTNVLLADTLGRISDDAPEKRAKVAAWIENFHMNVIPNVEANDTEPDSDQPVMIVPIGASGSGKSTYRDRVADYETFSWDDLRVEWYDDDYATAWAASCDDKEFEPRARRRFLQMADEQKDIYLDNTNLSKKRRAFFVNEARRRGYFIRAVLFPIDLDTLIARQGTREDKTVPPFAVKNQFMSLQYPQFGEFDDVVVVGTNLPEYA